MKKHVLVALCGFVMTAAAATAGAATVISATVTNQALAFASYTLISGLGTSTPSVPAAIAPGGSTSFTVSNLLSIPIAQWNFYYTAGSKQCKFMTGVTVNSGVPNWTKTGVSTGSTTAKCTATVTAASVFSPYSYSVAFVIK